MTTRTLMLSFLFSILAAVSASAQSTSPCAVNLDAVKDEPFVMAAVPAAGARVKKGFVVGGCSRTSDGRLLWRITVRSGKELATGSTKGGSDKEGPAVFSFTVDVDVSQPTMAYLEVSERSGTGKGPVSRVIIPLILTP